MADLRSFHESVKELMPPTLREPSSYTVAVLKLGVSPADADTREKYLWIECQREFTVGFVRQKFLDSQQPKGDTVLRHRSQVIDDYVKIGELDVYDDHLIVLEATTITGTPPYDDSGERALHAKDQSTQQLSSPHRITSGIAHSSRSEPILPVMSVEEKIELSTQDKTSSLTPSGTSPPLLESSELAHSNVMNNSSSPPDPEKAYESQESTLNVAEMQQGNRRTIQLQTLLRSGNPDVLEAGVQEGMKLLDRLKGVMLDRMEDDLHAEQLLKQIESLMKQATKTKTIIGVVGNTGAGKSSVINSILDEERLVPTNCMRACTAVVTEIAYNNEDTPYRARIEYIQPSDWEEELKVLFQDLITSSGTLSSEHTKEDTDAGIAYAKIKAVYPEKTREEIAKSSIEKMVHDVLHILGKSPEIRETNAFRFYRRLQEFVDSKEKTTSDKNTATHKKKHPAKEMEVWPLIKVVKIYVKSSVLSTGCVLVDLPGTHDSNAARAAVAESYMKQTTGLWIVTPINRAVDDKAAKSLLGESFKRQLKMDGGFNSVTFICSKTDDISVTEAQDSLGLEEQMTPLYAKMEELDSEEKVLEQELHDAEKSKKFCDEASKLRPLQHFKFFSFEGSCLATAVRDLSMLALQLMALTSICLLRQPAGLQDVLAEIDDELDIWEALHENIQDGKEAFLPEPETSRKRKVGDYISARKRPRQSSDAEMINDRGYPIPGLLEDENKDDYVQGSSYGQSVTIEQVTTKMGEFKTIRREARQSKRDIEGSMKRIREQQAEARIAREAIAKEITTACISGRNAYSKRAIAQDYASGIRELDQELACEENEATFDPEEEIKDYDKIATALPVFCVSSRGYQKLKGRFQKDETILGFKDIEETEIPLLQKHCTKLTEASRIANSQRFLKNLSRLLESLALWASSDSTVVGMTQEQKARAEQHLAGSMEKIKSNFDRVVKSTVSDLSRELSGLIFDKYELAVASATSHAAKTAQKWAMPINWAHRELGWEKAFSRQLPTKVLSFARHAFDVLTEFHRKIERRVCELGRGTTGLEPLRQQLTVYDDIFKETATSVKESINTSQKEINREFVPVIQETLRPVYEACVNEHGPGSFARMKNTMDTQISAKRFSMFRESVDRVRKRLLAMIKVQEKTLADKVDEVLLAIQRDYLPVLGCGEAPGQEMLLESQGVFRKDFMEILDESEEIFQKIALPPGSRDNNNETAGNGPNMKIRDTTPIKPENEVLQANLRDVPPTVVPEKADQMEDVQEVSLPVADQLSSDIPILDLPPSPGEATNLSGIAAGSSAGNEHQGSGDISSGMLLTSSDQIPTTRCLKTTVCDASDSDD
ncbi:MAG: hypothetical protein Q9225_007039 [Loekoesia sp. 1 TL-2023]